MPKLSIIIPVYNAAAYLPQTLDSILNQSLKDIELICVDDGSTDNSLQILKEYAAKDSRVQILQQQNLHAGVARNAGLDVATGEFVHFLDADDYVLDYAYEALYNKVIKYNLDVVKFASVAYDVTRETAVDLPSFTLSRLEAGYFNIPLTLDEGSPIYKVNVAPWNGIYRRSFLLEKNIRFNDLFCVNDRSFFNQVITNAGRMMLSRDRLVVHRVGLSDSLIGVRAQHFDCHFRSIELVEAQLLRDNVPFEVADRIMRKEFTDLFTWCLDFCRDGSELANRILEATEQFVHNYSGQYRMMLLTQYRIMKGKLLSPVGEKSAPEAVAVFHEASKAPKVSVVVPTFNVEDYLNEALYSLTIQTLEDIEFVCINDGSTDNSMVIMKEYANLDKRLRILDGPNGGYGKGMNRGINAAKGEYIGILEPDDFVPPDMFGSLYEIAKKNDLDFVKADFYRFMVNPNGSLKRNLNQLSNDKSYYGRVINPSEEPEVFKFIMNTWSGIYKLDFLNRWNIRHNETPGASYQDNGFWFQTFCRAERAWFVNRPYYMNRRDNPNSSMFSRKKFYCVTDEYRFIQDWMSKDPALEKFSDTFYSKKFSNFMVTYRRLAPESQRDYLHHICDEFRPAMDAGLLDEKRFGPVAWNQLKEILADPDAYYDKIRVSVIMPVYNAENYLRQTLDCLLVRNELQFEVICIDDGSTDGSLEILREYEAKDPRVIVLTQKNAGAGAARNNGLKIARGEYLSFLDADDFFEPDMLRLAYDRAHTLGTDITVFRCDQYFEATGQFANARYTINDSLLPQTQPFAGADIPYNIFKAFVGWAWDKLFRADFVRENNLLFQEQRTSNDMLFVFSAIVKAERISTMNAVLAHHRRDSGSLSVTREKSWHCFYNALVALRQQLKDWNVYEQYECDFINYSLHFALWNVTTLRGPSYHKLYDKLVNEWFEDLGVLGHDRHYFYNQAEYQKLQQMLTSTSEDFLYLQLDDAKTQASSLQLTNSSLTRKVEKLSRRRDKLEAKLQRFRQRDRKQKAKIADLKAKVSDLKTKNKAIKSSMIWKVGRIVTWLPRKLKKLFSK